MFPVTRRPGQVHGIPHLRYSKLHLIAFVVIEDYTVRCGLMCHCYNHVLCMLEPIYIMHISVGYALVGFSDRSLYLCLPTL